MNIVENNMELNIGIHTVIILTGPSQSGKSTWANLFQEKVSAYDNHLRTKIISSDEIRRQLLGEDLHRYDPRMSEVSQAAFDLLFEQLKAAVRYPVNTEFVIVDTTGMDVNFRKDIATIAKEHNYKTAIVMFDYATGDYFEGLSGHDKTIVSKHVDNFKKRVLPTIKRKDFNYSFSVKAKEEKFFEKLDVQIENYAIWRKSHIFQNDWEQKQPVAIIGDVHEHLTALETMINKLPEQAHLVFVGDLFDKGNQTKEMLDYIEQLIAKRNVKIIIGNHESFVARRLLGQIESIDKEQELFPSLSVFQSDKGLADRFLKLHESFLPFLCVHTHGKTVYITHAPCKNKVLGKLDEKSQKAQRNYYFSSRTSSDMEKELDFINQEAYSSHPLHVFGHVAHDFKSIVNKNKYWLDTGAVYGNKLSALVINQHGDTKIVTVDSSVLYEGNLLGRKYAAKNTEALEGSQDPINELDTKEENLSISSQSLSLKSKEEELIENLVAKYNLSPEDKYWLHSFDEGGAKFISGTMSPSRSTRTQLEPIDSAIQYFKVKGVDKVIIEPKFMGSRLQLYLFRDKTKDFAVTRSGTRAGNQEMLEKVLADWHEKLDKEDFWQDSIVLDGEILPWSAIGKELIEKEFIQYGKSIEKEWELLSSDINFNHFAKQIGIEIPSEKKGIETFMKQLDIYGTDYPVEYKAFSILMVDNNIWVEKNQEDIFKLLLPLEAYKIIDLNDENALLMAQEFFISLTQQANEHSFPHEGVVVKPLVYMEGVAPYMKVRNENYLHLVYGYDYLKKYQEKVSNKKINKKLDLSVKEYELGLKMLKSTNRFEKLDLACQMKFEMNQEQDLDSRL